MKLVLAAFLFLLPFASFPQELFPNTEPASSIPKKVIGIRYTGEFFNSSNRLGSWHALKCMYGLTPKLTLIGSVSMSNLHTKKFPQPLTSNFSFHHSPVTYQGAKVNEQNPYLLEGVYVYAKYRFLSKDAEHSHLRFAIYGELSKSFVAHRDADPSLNGNNTGLGGGIIVTKLYRKLAISLTAGYQHPFAYKEKDSLIRFQSGKALVNTVSLGYLLFPFRYKSYKDLNVNLYVEMMNKWYGEADYVHHGIPVESRFYPALMSGGYSELRPAIQFILNSNTRIDAAMSFPVYQKVETRIYPVYMINIQRYFFGS